MAQPLLETAAAPLPVLPNDLGEMTPERLPTIIRRAIRIRVWEPAEAKLIADMARRVAQHMHDDYDVSGTLLPALAMAVQCTPASSIQLVEECGEARLRHLAWAMLSVPLAFNCAVINGIKGTVTLAKLSDAIDAQIAEDRRVRALNTGDSSAAWQKICAMVDEAKQRYPQLGLSVGYIGGVHTWGDDRGYKVFTTLATRDCFGACNISFGDYAHNRLGDMLVAMEKRFAGWLAQTAQRLDAGDIRRVGA